MPEEYVEKDVPPLNDKEKTGNILEKPVNKGGRPKGSHNRPTIHDYMSESEREEYVRLYLKRAKENEKVLIHLMENILGKAPQSIDLKAQIVDKLINLD